MKQTIKQEKRNETKNEKHKINKRKKQEKNDEQRRKQENINMANTNIPE